MVKLTVCKGTKNLRALNLVPKALSAYGSGLLFNLRKHKINSVLFGHLTNYLVFSLKLLAMSIAAQNLKYLRKLRGWTQEEFANKLKIKRSLLGAYEEERAEPRLEVLELVSDMFRLSLDELLRKKMQDAKGSNYLAKRRAQKMAALPNSIQLVPVKAAAGYLAGYGDPEFLDELNTFTLPMLAPGNYRAFEIIGDSMLPTPSGSVIVAEKIENLENVKSNLTYIVVSRNEGIVYKRVMKNNKLKNKITLISDNTVFQPYTVNAEDILEIWKAEMVVSKANTEQRWDVNQLASLVSNLQDQVTTLKRKMN
jgi:transcriptional regulator with XRE-family HTH domain